MRSNARVAIAIAVTLACVAPSTASEARARADIVRGAHPSKIHLYDVDVFSCDDGRTRVPRARINDEYCDCGDGSDEPGTSACAGRGAGVLLSQRRVDAEDGGELESGRRRVRLL